MYFDDDLDRWEDRISEEYEEYLDSIDNEDAPVMSYEKFRDEKLDEASDRFAGMDEYDIAEVYA